MYRVSVYSEQPHVTEGPEGLLGPIEYLSWTDDYEQNQAQILGNDVIEDGKPAWGTHQITVRSVANQAIQFSTFINPAEAEQGTYDMYVVVEEL